MFKIEKKSSWSFLSGEIKRFKKQFINSENKSIKTSTHLMFLLPHGDGSSVENEKYIHYLS